MGGILNILRSSSPWIYLLLALLYLKQCFLIGPEFYTLKLDFVLYTPFMQLFWFLSLYFWFLFINEKGISKIFFSIFLIALIFVPIFILFLTQDILFSLPIFIAAIQPIINNRLNGEMESNTDFFNFMVMIVGIILLVISAILTKWLHLSEKSLLFGTFYYLFLFLFEFKFKRQLQNFMEKK